MKALVGAFNQEKALVGASSVIVETDGSSAALSWSLLVLVAVLVWLWVWVVEPLLVLVLVTVTLVVGEPMSEMSTSMGTRTEASHARAAPIPFTM